MHKSEELLIVHIIKDGNDLIITPKHILSPFYFKRILSLPINNKLSSLFICYTPVISIDFLVKLDAAVLTKLRLICCSITNIKSLKKFHFHVCES